MDNLRPAITAATIANVNAPKGKVFSPFDFVLRLDKPKPSDLNARILAALKVD